MRKALSTYDLKSAALYSEYVIPYNIMGDIVSEMDLNPNNYLEDCDLNEILEEYCGVFNRENVYSSIIPPNLFSAHDGVDLISKLNETNLSIAILYLWLSCVGYRKFTKKQNKKDEKKLKKLKLNRENLMKKIFNIENRDDFIVESANYTHSSESGDKKLYLALSNMKLIDTKNLSWRQIIDFREDKLSLKKFMALRHFGAKKYQDRSVEFIEDDIEILFNDYEEVVRKWGFDTKIGAAEMALSSKILMGSTVGALVSILMGAPLPAIISATTGAIFEAGRLSIYLSKRKAEYEVFANTNPIGYLSELKKLSLKNAEN